MFLALPGLVFLPFSVGVIAHGLGWFVLRGELLGQFSFVFAVVVLEVSLSGFWEPFLYVVEDFSHDFLLLFGFGLLSCEDVLQLEALLLVQRVGAAGQASVRRRYDLSSVVA